MRKSLKHMACAMASVVALGAATAQAAAPAFYQHAATPAVSAKGPHFGPFEHIVIIYQENHSFDNLYGGWGAVGSDTSLNGRTTATLTTPTQVAENGQLLNCAPQLDVNLAALPQTCSDSNPAVPTAYQTSGLVNLPFLINTYIPTSATTCPPPSGGPTNGELNGTGLPGGCTRDIFHRFYNEQFNIDGGKMDRYSLGEDAAGLTLGYYDTTQLPVYQYLHTAGAPNYIIADDFFQGSFGGSFLNHQWLVAAATPVFAGALNDGSSNDLHSVLDSNLYPTSTPLYTPTYAGVKDQQLTQSCSPGAGRGPVQPAAVCGDYAINTIQPYYEPYSPGTSVAKRLPPLTNPTIGDRLTAAGIDWGWYSGGWSNASGAVGAPGWTNGPAKGLHTGCIDPNANPTSIWPYCPDYLFQFHHQALAYFANYGPNTAGRTLHLRDEAEFISRAEKGNLKPVSFVKPIGEDNEHPGYASDNTGEQHLAMLLQKIFSGKDGDKTLVIVTYDEFGGQWDHVPPPGANGGSGVHDQWGPGTRIPALFVSPLFKKSLVDHAEHDTTSILATIETMFGLQPLGTRDAQVGDLFDDTMAQALGY